MKTNRILSTALLLLALCSAATAQQLRVDITLKDRGVVSCPLDDIEYMEIVQGANPGELDGVWYLGWKVGNNGSGTKTDMNGSETLVFTAGPKMKWIKSSTETVYDLTYTEDGGKEGGTFTAIKEGTTNKLTYQIVAIEGDLLLLKQGTNRFYFYKSKDAAALAEFVAYPTRTPIYTDANKLWAASVKGGATASDVTPMGRHFENYAAATAADKSWLANPNNQPDLSWHELGSKTWTEKTITLYPFGSPEPADVNQHSIGDCCMCAVFASFAYIYPEWIKTIIEQDGNNFTVHMFDPMGNPIDVVVDNKLMCNSDGGVGQVFGKNNKYNWATIMEKALMKWETRFKCNKIGGIGTEHAAPPFTGNGASYSFSPDRLYNSEFDLVVDYALSHGMISVGGFNVGDLVCGDPEMKTVTGHAFTVMYPDEGADYKFVMRNPWGHAGKNNSKQDGKLEIPNKREYLKTIDFRLVYPGEQMAQYKKENLSGYTVPNFKPMYYLDVNPSDEMLRMYNVKDFEPLPFPFNDETVIEEEE
ncbi:MAG: hypothetical protein J6V92_04245 [Bacteroidaceae bacterium]|nr:hypothetical protein [Bacteroidaceae bacterium]